MVRFGAAGTLVLAWVAGCNYFDSAAEGLIHTEKPDAGTADSGGKGGTGGAAGLVVEPIDSCAAAESHSALSFGYTDYVNVKTEGLTDSLSGTSCIDRPLNEVDGFFKVSLVRGHRYHFHVKAGSTEVPPGQDIALYILPPTCDDRDCLGGADYCGAGDPEHFSFSPDSTADYVLGIDGIATDPTSDPLQILPVEVECGNKQNQHGKSCDDGNTNDDDGCDSECRVVLSVAPFEEKEPNDDQFIANVVTVKDGPSTVRGSIGGRGSKCAPDFFLVHVTDPSMTLDATVLTGGGDACDSAPDLTLDVYNSHDVTLRKKPDEKLESATTGGPCPAVHAANLAPDDYYVVLRTTQPSDTEFSYSLKLELTPKAP